MIKLTNKLLANSLFWFAIICTIFGVASQFSEKIWIVPADFYLQIAIVSMLGGLFIVFKEKH